MIVFISDLHLKADRQDITHRFDIFLAWAMENASAVYILGDLFHVWAGDDCADAFALAIADKLRALSLNNIALYFIAGNRDFLLGKAFAARAGMTILQEPYRLDLGETACLLTHGDRYCLNDKRHQWFRVITRNRWFTPLFMCLPAKYRQRMAGGVRQQSQIYQKKYQVNTDVNSQAVITEMQQYHVQILIHGHTHLPGETQYQENGMIPDPLSSGNRGDMGLKTNIKYTRFVLSDWDDTPQIMCYDKSRGFIFEHISEV